ncbi:MAG: DUF2442 domain-containing protein [Flavobacteriales bacterium]|nr:DUF2442 domain-containing protein [Flavobacteriales bacterium]
MRIADNVRIKKATYKGDYAIRFQFTDGHVSEIDFHPFLSAAGQNPMNSQYLDVLRFRQFKLHRNVDVYWDDWEMCFRFETLYAGKLPKMPQPLARPVRRKSMERRTAAKA